MPPRILAFWFSSKTNVLFGDWPQICVMLRSSPQRGSFSSYYNYDAWASFINGHKGRRKREENLSQLEKNIARRRVVKACAKTRGCSKPRLVASASLARKFSYISVAFPSTLSFLIRAASGYYTVSPVAGLSNFTVILYERLASTRGHRSKILHTRSISHFRRSLLLNWLCWCADGWTYLLNS